jgi:hypothetical protein
MRPVDCIVMKQEVEMAEIKVSVVCTVVKCADIVVSVNSEDADEIHAAVVKAVQEDNLRETRYINWELDSDDIEVVHYE